MFKGLNFLKIFFIITDIAIPCYCDTLDLRLLISCYCCYNFPFAMARHSVHYYYYFRHILARPMRFETPIRCGYC